MQNMVQLHIICRDSEQAKEITTLLYEEKLVLNEIIVNDVTGRHPDDNGELTSIEEVLIIGTTKALLFKAIDELLQLKYPETMPIIYATPIVYMNAEQSEHLKNNTSKV